MATLNDARNKFRKGFKPISTPDPFEGTGFVSGDADALNEALDEVEEDLEKGIPTASTTTMSGLVQNLRKKKAQQGPNAQGPNKWRFTKEGMTDAIIDFGLFKGQLVSVMARDACEVTGRDGRVRRGRGYLGWMREKCTDSELNRIVVHWLDATR